MGRRILLMGRDFFLDIFGPGPRGYEVIEDALPPGTRIVKVSMDAYFSTDQIAFMLESPDWPEVAEGARVPEIMPVLRRLETKS